MRDSVSNGLDRAAGYILCAPAVLVVLGLMLYPLLYAVYLSFVTWQPGQSTWVGFDNYVRLFADPLFWLALWNTFFYAFWNLAVGTSLALSFALLMNRPGPGARILRVVIFLPTVLSTAVAAFAWLWFLDANYGLLNRILVSLNILPAPIAWLTTPQYAKWGIVMINIWLGTGLSAILLLAGLQSIPPEVHEAAAIDGANSWQRFRHVTLPLLRPVLAMVLVVKLIGSFKTFDQVFIMTGGGPLYQSSTILTYLYQRGFEYFDFGFASAVGVVFFVIVGGLSVFQLRVMRGQK